MRKIFKSNEEAYNSFRDYFLEYSREHHRFPRIRVAKRDLNVPINRNLSYYDIELDNLKLEVIRKRIENDIYGKGLDPKKSKINSELGLNIDNWVEHLGFDTFSDMRLNYTGKQTRKKQRVFKTIEEASKEFEDYFLKHLRKEQSLPPIISAQKFLKTDRTTYFKPENIKRIKIRALKRRLEELHEEKLDLMKYEINSKLGINLKKWPEVLSHHRFRDFKKTRKRFANLMTGNIEEEKNKKLIIYSNLIRQMIKPKPKKTSEDDMCNFIKERTNNNPPTSDITVVKNYLLYMKEIEGSILEKGYWRVE